MFLTCKSSHSVQYYHEVAIANGRWKYPRFQKLFYSYANRRKRRKTYWKCCATPAIPLLCLAVLCLCPLSWYCGSSFEMNIISSTNNIRHIIIIWNISSRLCVLVWHCAGVPLLLLNNYFVFYIIRHNIFLIIEIIEKKI